MHIWEGNYTTYIEVYRRGKQFRCAGELHSEAYRKQGCVRILIFRMRYDIGIVESYRKVKELFSGNAYMTGVFKIGQTCYRANMQPVPVFVCPCVCVCLLFAGSLK